MASDAQVLLAGYAAYEAAKLSNEERAILEVREAELGKLWAVVRACTIVILCGLVYCQRSAQ